MSPSLPAFALALLAAHDRSGEHTVTLLLPCLVSQQELLVQKQRFEILAMEGITIRSCHFMTLGVYKILQESTEPGKEVDLSQFYA